MQTTDMSTMLQILQSPMGAALIPTLHDRENMVMDQSRATLADTISRTGINQDENARKAQMHPLEMDAKRVGTEGQVLQNDVRRFDANVKEIRGGAAGEAFRADEKDDARKFLEGSKNIGMVAARLQIPEGAVMAPGQRRAMAERELRSAGLERMIPDLPEDENQIGPQLKGVAEHLAKFSRQYVTSEMQATARSGDVDDTNASRERIALRRDKVMQDIAKMKAEAAAAKAAAGGKKGKGGEAAMKNSNILAIYADNATKALNDGDLKTAEFWNERAKEVAELLKHSAPKPAMDKVDTTIRVPGGIQTTSTQVPRGGSGGAAATDTKGWSNPQVVDGQGSTRPRTPIFSTNPADSFPDGDLILKR